MKIHQSTLPRTAEGAAESTGRAVSGPVSNPAPVADDLTMSPLASQVRDIGTRLTHEADGDIDHAKVEEIRQAIAEGRLKMDPSKIADGLLATLRELAQDNGR